MPTDQLTRAELVAIHAEAKRQLEAAMPDPAWAAVAGVLLDADRMLEARDRAAADEERAALFADRAARHGAST